MLFGVFVEHEYDNSVYMSKTFYGHTSNVNGLLDLDRSDTHIHNIEAKKMQS